MIPRARRLSNTFGRGFRYVDQHIQETLASEEVAAKFPVRYLSMVDEWGENKLGQAGRDLLRQVVGR